jgi:Flp pilus assembly pilin Flp
VFSNICRLIRADEEARESGQTLVEYALILMLVVLLTVTALQTIGDTLLQFITDAAEGVGGG